MDPNDLSRHLNQMFYASDGASFSPPDWSAAISDAQIAAIREVPHLKAGMYARIDPRHALDFYARRYVRQLFDFMKIGPETAIADIGAGYGWLAMAFAMCGVGGKIVAVELDGPRLEAGKEIAAILGVADRIDWRVGGLGSLPLEEYEVDAAYCVEVLEHVQRAPSAVPDLCRVSRELVILTTPNLWFPAVAHDTRLPFCHWLPIPMRKAYARLFGRHHGEVDNLFYSPRILERQMPGFKRVSRFLHCDTLEKYLATFPCHLPYGRGADQYRKGPGALLGAYYRVASTLGRRSHWVLPNIAGVYRRIAATPTAGGAKK